MKRSTIVCIVVVILIFLAIIVTCIQVSIYENSTASNADCADKKCMHRRMNYIISLSERNLNQILPMAERFPYVAAVNRNSSHVHVWPFSCFASVILFRWIVTSAHCRVPGSTHRVIVFHDFAQNQTYAFPILFWRIHEKYNSTIPTPKYDIAVAKLNMQYYPYILRPAVFDETPAKEVEASVWKTVSTMDKRIYLTNHFEKYEVAIVNSVKCFETYGVAIDDSLICIDTSDYEDCFIHDFGPIYSGDKVVGVIAVKPTDCDVKLSIFTNISYYTNWILRTTHEG